MGSEVGVSEGNETDAAPGLITDDPRPQDDEVPVPGLLVLLAVIVSVAALAVALTLLSARGIGPFAGPSVTTGVPSEATDITIAAVTASSELTAERQTRYDARNLIDQDPTTAWNEGESGDGEGEWIDLQLRQPSVVTGLLVWNGYQSEDFYAQHNRVRRLQLTLGGLDDEEPRTFSVQLLDRRGPQSITLPEAVVTDSIRLEITGTFEGTVYNDTALSELQVRGVPRSADTG